MRGHDKLLEVPIDLASRSRLPRTKLVAGETDHCETPAGVALLELLEVRVLRCVAALRSDVDDEQRLALVVAERRRRAVQGFDWGLIDGHEASSGPRSAEFALSVPPPFRASRGERGLYRRVVDPAHVAASHRHCHDDRTTEHQERADEERDVKP